MATDFFERQAHARRTTWWLIAMFALAVVGIVGTTIVVTAVAVGGGEFSANGSRFGRGGEEFPWQIPLGAGAAAIAMIGGGSLYKIAELSGGGTVVAERLGGRRVYPNTTDFAEKRLLNVVEEMALASGVPVPPVFLLEQEQGINAFAAGFSPSDAVVGVTRGCAEQLTRDQLQGVIAHEFSHILNGDMRLNLRVIGVLYGILLMGLVGRELLFAAGRSHSRSDNRRDGGQGRLILLLIGLAFMVIGFIGLFIGNLIKAAVSRQREYLADASAVQFTRNPEGIAGALRRIGAAVFGSKLVHPNAAEASHMYFSPGISSLFATHPPLGERIRRIDPQWDGKFPTPLPEHVTAAMLDQGAVGLVGEADISGTRVPVRVVEHAADQVGSPRAIHQSYAAELVAAMPPAIVDAVHEPYGARAVIFATLLDRDSDIRATQLRELEQIADEPVFELTLRLAPAVNQLDVRARLPLVDMSLPALRALSPAQYRQFIDCFTRLVQADQRLGLFEWTLHHILLRHLRPQFERVRSPQIVYHGLQRLAEPCSVLLSCLARASDADDQAAFDSGAGHLADVTLQLLPAEQCTLTRLNDSLRQLSQVVEKQRRRLIDACAACICADRDVRVREAELLRAICDILDCPMPPLLPGQPLAN
ncbi:MAG: M48 family metallopeptidase [Planctomycetes bacterium]|nr:M48 family metallopeptidase [Planctomycetota bacterium]